MKSDSSAEGVDTDSRREYLRGLRELALLRMRQDEEAVQPVSRRGALKWVGMAAVGAAVGLKPLRVAAEEPSKIVGALRMRAAMMGSVRAPAPQYGAPSWPAQPEPYGPVRARGEATTSRSELADVKLWRGVSVQLVLEKRTAQWKGFISAPAKEGFYADPWGGGTHALLAIADPETDFAYIVRGDQTFYTAVDSVLYGCTIGPGVLSLHGNLLRTKGSNSTLAEVIAAFAQVSDSDAYRRDREGTSINLEAGLPQAFWIRNGDFGWQSNYVSLAHAQRHGDVLELSVRSDGYESMATFIVDLRAMKLVKTQFEGSEWPS